MERTTFKPVHSLILDAGPILKNEPAISTLLGQCETLYSVPAVIDEIRDEVARARVETTFLPFLTLRTPSPASVKIISDFARRTGDLEVLSKPDIQILALTYELECERNHGDWRLRSVPGQKRLNGAPPESIKSVSGAPEEDKSSMEMLMASRHTQDQTIGAVAEPITTDVENSLISGGILEPVPSSARSETFVSSTISREETSSVLAAGESLANLDLNTNSNLPDTEEHAVIVEENDSDSDDWITPSNIKEHQAKDMSGSTEPQEEAKVMQVAAITSDFAMQNVLLRMNLNLLSPSLQRIRQLKTWVLRCHACFEITKNMSKQFCSRCGKPTLLRTSCSTDRDGVFRVHLKKNMQWNTRGDVFSIPKPVAGTANGKIANGGGKGGWGQGLILAEDQKEYIQAMTNAKRRKEKDLMDEDYLPNILSGDRRGGGGKPKVGAGKNVNSRKRK